MLPGLWDPVDDFDQVVATHVLIYLRLNELSPQEPTQESFDWLCVVGAQHPPTPGQDIGSSV